MSMNLSDIVEVKPLEKYVLHLQFADGKQGRVNIAALIKFEGVFEKLNDKKYFDSVTVNRELGTVCWPNGADLAPEVLYENLGTI